MPINWEKTRKNIIDDGRTPTSWGRMRGFSSSAVSQIFLGIYPDTGKLRGRMINQLRIDGYLVEEEALTGGHAA